MVELGSLVIANYKTGTYIGTLIDIRGPKAVVEVQAVYKHPEQGNLHYPQETEGVFFHQRKALAHREKALMPVMDLVPYEDEVPEYRQSLAGALDSEYARMDKMWLQPELQKWARRAQQELDLLRAEYGFVKE